MARKKRKAGGKQISQADSIRGDFQMPPIASRVALAALAVLFLAHVAVHGWRVMAAERNFDADSFNYATIARNLSEGRGFAQSAPGFNQPSFWGEKFSPDFSPQTRAKHSALYPPLIFAVAETSGISHGNAALFVNVAAYFAALALVFLLGFRLQGVGAGLLMSVAFAAWPKSDWLFSYIWTEPGAMTLAFGIFALLAKNPGGRAFCAAGILTGLAYMQRSAMLPLVGVGIAAALLSPKNSPRALLLFLAGASVGGLRHLIGTGISYGTYPTPLPFQYALFKHYVLVYFSEMGAMLLILAALAALVFWREMSAQISRRVGWTGMLLKWDRGEVLMAAWIAGYSAFLVIACTLISVLNLYERYLYLMQSVGIVLGASLAWRLLAGWRWRIILAGGVFALVMVGEIARDWGVLAEGRNVSDQARIAASERLTWLDENLGGNDYVIGVDTMDLPYYFPDRVSSTPSISPYPFSPFVDAGKIAAIVRRRCGQHDNHYLLVRRGPHPNADPNAFGPFIGGIMAGYPAANVEEIADLADAAVYRLTHCGAG